MLRRHFKKWDRGETHAEDDKKLENSLGRCRQHGSSMHAEAPQTEGAETKAKMEAIIHACTAHAHTGMSYRLAQPHSGQFGPVW